MSDFEVRPVFVVTMETAVEPIDIPEAEPKDRFAVEPQAVAVRDELTVADYRSVAVVDPIGNIEAEPEDRFAVEAEGMTAAEADHSFAADIRDIEVRPEQRIAVEVRCNRLEVWSSS